ncbi:hypothetical protein PIB30_024752 [Stylosanthes scabra]|uniref:Uncharacterized protein n=1 Tax=Stylosanthes scabra TaxID=79078 RepID=A0ABU6TBQ7_9FABA|nr:hypothetical protein [Stylosanthes scabra]
MEYTLLLAFSKLERHINKRYQEKAGKYNNTMSWWGSSVPKEWEERTKQLNVKWEQVQRKQSKSEQDNSAYEDSRFMFEDGIVPYPSQLCANNNKDGSYSSLSLFSFEDLLIEKQRKELMQRVHVFTNQVMHAPRDSSKRLPVFKDIAPY